MNAEMGPMELVERARAGHKDALGELCALYRNYLRMVVRSGLGARLREKVELSDVVQEALVEVVRQFPQFTGTNEAALVGWMRRLVGQKLADLGRYHNRAKRAGGIAALPLDGGGAGDLGGDVGAGLSHGKLLDVLALSQTSPSEAASKRELIVLLADTLAALPEDEAEVLWLYHAEGMSFEAIGAQMSVSRKVIRGVWARGLKHLKRVLDRPTSEHLKWDDPGSSATPEPDPAQHDFTPPAPPRNARRNPPAAKSPTPTPNARASLTDSQDQPTDHDADQSADSESRTDS